MGGILLMAIKRPGMYKLTPHVLALLLLCALSCPAGSADQPTKLVVTEGRYIGYTSVADALTALQAKGLTGKEGLNGDLSFIEPDNGSAWTFVGKENAAYPTVVRYVYTRQDAELHAELTILCEAAAARCEKFHVDIREHLAQLAKMMAGDPSAKCTVSGDKLKCGTEP